jgi:integrase
LRLLGDVAHGLDVATPRARAKATPTVAEFAATFLADRAPRIAPATLSAYRRMLASAILPALGAIRLDRVERGDVLRLQDALKNAPVRANRCVQLVGVLMSAAEAQGLRPRGSNPTVGVQKHREKRRERFLSEAELARLGLVLRKMERENPFAVAAIRLLVLTGARRSEILNARWSDVDFQAGTLRVEQPKEGKPKLIKLAPPALAVLQKIPRVRGNPYVIPGGKESRPLADLSRVWDGRFSVSRVENGERVRLPGVRDLAGLPNVRLHDLRHSYASVAVAGGASLPLIGGLLGHRRAATTERYAHLSDDPLRKVADTTASRIQSAMDSTPRKVASLRRR